jgi:hypothetical protein
MLENIETQSEIPPQLTEKVEKAAAAYLVGGRFTFSEDTLINVFIGFLFQLIFYQVEDLSFLTINSLISISLPGITSKINAVMIKYIYFDILFTELWMN